MDFVAIDVETANADMASICQIGVALCERGAICETWKSYVDPQDEFDLINVSIHGIDQYVVQGAPTLPMVAADVRRLLEGRVAVCHTHFDRVAIHQAFGRHGLAAPGCTWLDSARVARRTWEAFAWKGYGLSRLCESIGYRYQAHDALEDAKAAAQVMYAAMGATGLGVEAWLARVRQPIDPTKSGVCGREGNPDGPLYGEVLVFTGSLAIPRREAADMAAQVGCTVDVGVTKKTSLLVVGDQDILKLAGHERSSKHRKAEALIAAGQGIRILRETDFRRMVELG